MVQGTAAEARLCTGYGTLPVLPAGVAADHCGHHAGRGDPEDPPASAARGGPTPDCSSPCPPRSLCVVLPLTVRGGERTVSDRSHRKGPRRRRLLLRLRSPRTPPVGGEGWLPCVSTPSSRPAAARMPHPSPAQA